MTTTPQDPRVNNIESSRLTREQLYDIVWSEPIQKVSLRYGLSDRGLAKICYRLHVPVPGRGYWQQKAVGKTVRQPPLKPLPDSAPITERAITLRQQDPIAEEPPANPVVAEQRARESDPERQIQVVAELVDPHPLVERTGRALRRRKPDERSLLHPSLKRCLDVHVTRETSDRALRILDALVRALEKRRFAITCPADGPQRTIVNVDGEGIGVSMEERIHQEVVPELKSALARRPEYSFLRPPPRYRYTPTSQLVLRITERDLHNIRQTWGDGKRKTLEHQLNSFVIGLVAAAEERKAARQRAEEARIAHEQWEREEAERQRKRWEQERRIRLLDQDLTLWSKSRRVRDYVEAFKTTAAARGAPIESESDLGRWLDWATRYADRLDPSTSLRVPRDPWEVAG